MSGTPLVTGPVNLIGPLSCMKDTKAKRQAERNDEDYNDTHHCTVAELHAFEKRWKAVLKSMRNEDVQTKERADLVGGFFRKLHS